jgi:hypothetical protein
MSMGSDTEVAPAFTARFYGASTSETLPLD